MYLMYYIYNIIAPFLHKPDQTDENTLNLMICLLHTVYKKFYAVDKISIGLHLKQ